MPCEYADVSIHLSLATGVASYEQEAMVMKRVEELWDPEGS
jgi:hypothetical protein